MGKVLKTSGLTLLIVGFVFVIISGSLTVYTLGNAMDSEKILDNDDFTHVGENTYRAGADAEDLTSAV